MKTDGHWLDAATAYVESLKRDPLSSSTWVQLGHRLKEGQALDAAENAYRFAIDCDGIDPDPRLHLGHLLKRRGQLAQALKTFIDLQTLAHAPDVAQEIRGLRVALHPANRGTENTLGELEPELPVALASGLVDAEAFLTHAIADIDQQEASRATVRVKRFTRKREFRVNLVPKAHLVITNGVFVATTDCAQFAVVSEEPYIVGWVEIDIGIEADVPFVEPIFLIEHSSRWQAHSSVRLKPLNGRFHAICLLAEPVVSLRLDPMGFKGAFTVTHFTLKQIGISKVLKHARKMAPGATSRLLKSWYRHRSLTILTRDLAESLAYPGLDAYQRWLSQYDVPSSAKSALQRQEVARWPKRPALTVCLQFNPSDPVMMEETLSSLKTQSYPDWSLCLLPDRPLRWDEQNHFERTCDGIPGVSIHADITSAIDAAGQGYIVTLTAGNRVSPSALFRIAEEIFARQCADLVYCDEDHLCGEKRCDPLFKPDWDADYQAATGYVGDFFAIRCDLLTNADLKHAFVSENWAKVVLRAIENLSKPSIIHIAEVLHHRRLPPAKVVSNVFSTSAHPVLDVWPSVSLIIPTRDSVDLLRQCIESLRFKTDYPDLDILVIDNGSTEAATLTYLEELAQTPTISVVPVPGPFNFSRLNNIAVARARGTIVGLVNNDILAVEPDWLKIMVTEAVRSQIGAVGAKLLYPSGHVQHAGIACGVGLVAAHPHKFRDLNDSGYMCRLSSKHRVSAVTAACLVVEKRKYLEVGGMDEEHLRIAFNDVDLCLKLGKAGYHNLITPQARLIHLESATRGLDMGPEKTDRYLKEAETMIDRWSSVIHHDPYYSPNLTHEREDYSIKD